MGWVDPLAIEFTERLAAMTPSERMGAIKRKIAKVAIKNDWIKDPKITKMNGRDVYKGTDGRIYATDTQHGTIEYTDKRGAHLGEFDIDGNQTKPADTSGGHDLKC